MKLNLLAVQHVILVIALVLMIPVAVQAQTGSANSEWHHYAGDKASTKYAPLDQINVKNVANLASAKKRIKQNERNRLRNRKRKSILKTETRRFLDALRQGDMPSAQQNLSLVTKRIDQIAAKGTLHKNTAARKKSRLARLFNAATAAKSG